MNKNNNDNGNKKREMELLLEEMFKHQLQIKMYHFQTQYYGAHKASDKYLEKFRDHLDRFMEVAQGIFGRLSQSKIDLRIDMATDNNIMDELNKFVLRLVQLDAIFTGKTDLLAIRDEILADLNQLKYLITFK